MLEGTKPTDKRRGLFTNQTGGINTSKTHIIPHQLNIYIIQYYFFLMIFLCINITHNKYYYNTNSHITFFMMDYQPPKVIGVILK